MPSNRYFVKRKLKAVIDHPRCNPTRKGFFILCLAYFEGMLPDPPSFMMFSNRANVVMPSPVPIDPADQYMVDDRGIADLLARVDDAPSL
jgi:hypothetical protein